MRSIQSMLFIALLLAACHKGNNGMTGCPLIAGITATDANGAMIFPPGDTTDWRTVDTWCPHAEALFAGLPPATVLSTPLPNAQIIAYPNPCDDQFRLHVVGDTLSYADVRIVNDAYQLVHARDSITGPVIFSTDAWGGADGRLFRVFYRIVHANGSAHRGHGDIQYGP